MFPLPPTWRLVISLLVHELGVAGRFLLFTILGGVVLLVVDAVLDAARSWGAP